jgi:hypothetical protein
MRILTDITKTEDHFLINKIYLKKKTQLFITIKNGKNGYII